MFNIKQIINCIKSVKIGITEPVIVQADDGVNYVMKYLHEYCTGKILFNEIVSYRLGLLLGVPMPKCYIGSININSVNNSDILSKTTYPDSCVFLSEYRKGNTNIAPNILKNATNQNDIPSIILFDQIILNEDRGMNPGNIYYDRKEKKILAIDHSHVFKLGEIWDVAQVTKLIEDCPLLIDSITKRAYSLMLPYMSGHSPFHTVNKRILAITDKEINDLFEDIPEEWGISAEEIAIINKLIYTQLHCCSDIIDMIKAKFSK